MDRFIAKFTAIEQGGLKYCFREGVAYQPQPVQVVEYGRRYFEKYQAYEGTAIAEKINAGRVSLVNRYVTGPLLDVGIGSGEFIRSRNTQTWGYDINPAARRWLRHNGRISHDFDWFDGLSFWDVIEHIPTPEDYFSQIREGAFLFTSIPLFPDLDHVIKSKHYRPNEHLYYFTQDGFINWMALHNFVMLEMQGFEIDAGRDSIYSFVFRKITDV